MAPSAGAVARLNSGCLTTRGVFCRSCGDTCEPDAIRFTPAVGGPPIPAIDADACTGCGDCVDICPTHAIALRERQSEEDS